MDSNASYLIHQALNCLSKGEYTSNNMPLGSTWFPNSHLKALELGSTIVEGIRGAGKSFWALSLTKQDHRSYINNVYRSVGISSSTKIYTGYGTKPDMRKYPNQTILEELLSEDIQNIWYAVLANCLPMKLEGFPKESTWSEKNKWIGKNAEFFFSVLEKYDKNQDKKGIQHLIIFDALDRLAEDWGNIRLLMRSLLQTALRLRYYDSIHVKIFLRTDMAEDEQIWSFPDASKLKLSKSSLTWNRTDLYAMLFQSLINDTTAGAAMRQVISEQLPSVSWGTGDPIWQLPKELLIEENQKRLFYELAGEFMGKTAKKGFTYSWLPSHLMDGREQVSPRSFIYAIKEAAKNGNGATPDHTGKPLYYKDIHVGVQEASKIRVNELKEDYEWISDFMKPMKNRLMVPCDQAELIQIWQDNNTLEAYKEKISAEKQVSCSDVNKTVKIPRDLEKGLPGVLDNLIELGVLETRNQKPGRVQMPDVYRIAFGIKRKGGVKPLKS